MPSATEEIRCRLLEWDTEHFGFPIAKLEGEHLSAERARHAEAWCRERSIRCLYFLANPKEPNLVSLAHQFGFDFVDARFALRTHCPNKDCAPAPESISIVPATERDLPTLEKIAVSAHRNTRFFTDSRFPRERAEDLYRRWIRSDVMNGTAFVARIDEDLSPLGYVTLQPSAFEQEASIRLIAVTEEARGRGIAKALVHAAIDRAGQRESETVSVVTQGANVAAQRLYQVVGFRTVSCRYWYHRWFP